MGKFFGVDVPGRVRDAVLELLDQIYCPMKVSDIALVLGAYAGSSPDDLLRLRNLVSDLITGERNRYSVSSADWPWLTPALGATSCRSVDDFVTRSDWPMRDRVVDDFVVPALEMVSLRYFCDAYVDVLEARSERWATAALFARIEELSARLPRELVAMRTLERGEPIDWIEVFRDCAEDEYGRMRASGRAEPVYDESRFDELTPTESLFGRDA